MTQITREELLALARVSQLELTSEELETMPARLGEVLQYAAKVKELEHMTLVDSEKNSNVMRADEPVLTDARIILDAAPEREADYFVVPRILESADARKKGAQ
jgi:aspartyl/glutamyl-tRNA(Asn/Gln) amidotransferase C subunit